jgi:hypothetical protein
LDISASNLEHDPEKWEPVFGKDHAQTKGQSGMPIQLNLIPFLGTSRRPARGLMRALPRRVSQKMRR